MKKLIIAAVGVVLLLTGCAPTGEDNVSGGPVTTYDELNPDDWYIQQIHTSDGSTVECIVYYQYTSGGPAISCDWDNVVGAFGEDVD